MVGCLWREHCMKDQQNIQGSSKNSTELNWIINSSNQKTNGMEGKQRVSSDLEYCLHKTPVPPTTVAIRSPSANINCCKSVENFCDVMSPISVIINNHLNELNEYWIMSGQLQCWSDILSADLKNYNAHCIIHDLSIEIKPSYFLIQIFHTLVIIQ